MDGWYEVECWGTCGGWIYDLSHGAYTDRIVKEIEDTYKLYGKGSYTKGTIFLRARTNLYVCVGTKQNGFNVSRTSGSGSGSTDIRLDYSSNDAMHINGRKSRIMVASSGSGGFFGEGLPISGLVPGTPKVDHIHGSNVLDNIYENCQGANGGTLTGNYGEQSINKSFVSNKMPNPSPGTQTSPGKSYYHRMGPSDNVKCELYGGFGTKDVSCLTIRYSDVLGQVSWVKASDASQASGGYYTGSGVMSPSEPSSSSSGTCYVSGYPGCDAIAAYSTENHIVHTGQPNHYSGYIFSNSTMLSGNSFLQTPSGAISIGNTEDGHARFLLKERAY